MLDEPLIVYNLTQYRMLSSFLFSVVKSLLASLKPSLPSLGIWLEAEKMVRNLSVTHSHVYVISGSIFDENADGHRDDDGNITRLVLRPSSVSC